MFDEDLSFTIEQRYPYPIAVAFRRLETDEYSEAGPVRLKGLLEVAERSVHALALIVLSNVVARRADDVTVDLPAVFGDDFARRFGALSFGTMVQILREGARWLGEDAFISELREYLFDGSGIQGESLRAIEELNTIRNRLAHPTQEPTRKEIVESCEASETAVERCSTTSTSSPATSFCPSTRSRSSSRAIVSPSSPSLQPNRWCLRELQVEGGSLRSLHGIARGDRQAEEGLRLLNLSPLVIHSTEGEKACRTSSCTAAARAPDLSTPPATTEAPSTAEGRRCKIDWPRSLPWLPTCSPGRGRDGRARPLPGRDLRQP